jgi:hypothetical protein
MPKKKRLLPSNTLTPDSSGEAYRGLKGVGLVDNYALMSVHEAAQFLRMSQAWLYQSNVPFVRIDSARRYRRIDLIEFVEQRLARPVQVVRG